MNAMVETGGTANALPSPMPPNMDRSMRVFKTRLMPVGLSHEIYSVDAPTADEREALEYRAARLTHWLAPSRDEIGIKAHGAAIKAEVAAVLGTMAIRTGNETDAEIMLRIYVKDLIDLPLFAVQGACRDFRRGVVGDKRWAPTQAELRDVAQRYVSDLAKERRDIETVLCAKVVEKPSDSEHRKAVVEREKAKLKDMRQAGIDAENGRISDEAKFRAEEMRAERERKKAEADHLTQRIMAGLKDDRPMPKLDPSILAQFPIKQGVSS